MRIVLVRQTKPYQVNMVVPIGMLCLATYLRERTGSDHEVFILDNRLERWPMDTLVERTVALKPDVVGATAMTHEVPETNEFLDRLKAEAPDVLRVAGGVHPSSEPEMFLETERARYVAIGEAEQTFAELIAALDQGRDAIGIPGLARLEDGRPVRSEPRQLIEDLNALPSTDYSLIQLERYFGWPSGDNLFHRPQHVGYMSSRGCPFRCGYCHNMFGRRYRPLSADRVLSDLEVLVGELGVREIHFWDDVFNLNKQRTLEICNGIVARGLDIRIAFPNGVRIEPMDEEMIDALVRAGMRRISYGIESGDPRTLESMQRYGDLDKIRKVVKATVDRGVLVKGLFILGAPDETAEQMENTIGLALELPLHYVSFNRFIPLPSAPLGKKLIEQRRIPASWEDYHYECSDWNVSAVSDTELAHTIRSANRRFYLRPKTVFNILRKFPWHPRLVLMYLTWAWGYIFAVRKGGSRGMGMIRWIWSRTD